MSPRSSPFLIVIASVFVAAGVYFWLRGVPAASHPAASGSPSDLVALEERVATLERTARAPAAARSSSPLERAAIPPSERTVVTSEAASIAELVERIEALERRLDERHQGPVARSPAEIAALELASEREQEEAVRAAKAVLEDPSASREAKLAAHEALRNVVDAYTPAMVADLAEIGMNDPDPGVRADVWRNFDGSSHLPDLVPHLLRALTSDSDPGPRNEASETLGNYVEDPEVLAALRYAAQNDSSPQVRRKIERTLAEWAWLVRDP